MQKKQNQVSLNVTEDLGERLIKITDITELREFCLSWYLESFKRSTKSIMAVVINLYMDMEKAGIGKATAAKLRNVIAKQIPLVEKEAEENSHIGCERLVSYFMSAQAVLEYAHPDVSHRNRGKKIIEASKLGHQVVHGSLAQKEKRRKEYVEHFENLSRKRPLLSKNARYEHVAREFGVSSKTIKRSLKPKK